MRLPRIVAVMLTLWAVFASRSFGESITFTHQGVGNASLNGQRVFDVVFTITAVGDTINRRSFDGGFLIEHSNASIAIASLGTFTFLVPTVTAVNQRQQDVGFGRIDLDLSLFFGPRNNPVFSTWDMLSSIGPVNGSAELLQWGSGVPTSGGLLAFDDGGSPAVFSATTEATPIPEPASLGLVGLGLAVASIGERLRRRNSDKASTAAAPPSART